MLGRIIRWSLDRPRLIAWACLWFFVWGAFYVRDVQLDFLPNLAPAETTIQTEAPGLVAEQVEQLVTRPIESALVGAAGVGDVKSQSVQGLSMITVRFADGADPYQARQSVAESLSAAAGALPSSATAPRIAPLASEGAAVTQLGFTSTKLDPMALRDIIQWTVRPRLQAATGVARVSIYGGQTRRIEVRARPADLSDSDLGFLDILNAVKRVTSVAGAGFIDTPTQRVLIEPRGQALTPDDVAAGQIQVPGTAPVRIGDVSDVVEAPAPAFGDALINGKPGVLVDIAKQYGANTLRTTHAVEAALAELRPSLSAQGVVVSDDLDRPASFTLTALSGIAVDLLIGAILIAIALMVFMREPRAVLISLISIPLSLLAAMVTLKALGWGVNSMTLGGLILSLGLVIDDAVIGVENVITRLRDAEHEHASDRETILNAFLEVRGPVTYAIFAVIVVLAPLLALGRVQGALLAPLAAAVIAASLASLLVATVVTPALCLLFHRHDGPPAEPRLLTRIKTVQDALLTKICARPRVILIVSGLVIAAALGVFLFYRSELLPSVHDGQLVAEADAPPSTSLNVMRGYGAHIADAVVQIPGVNSITQRIGRDATGADSWGPEHTVFDIGVKPGLSVRAQDEIEDRIRDELSRHPDLAPVLVSRFDTVQHALRGGAPVQITLYGRDLDALDASAARIGALLKTLPGQQDVQVGGDARGPVMRIDLNFPRLALYGLSAADVLDTVQAAYAGERVAQIFDNGRVVDLAVSAQDKLRRDPEGVGELLLRSNSGVSVPLNRVANVYLTDSRVMISHEGGFRRQIITAGPVNPVRFVESARKAIAAHIVLPSGSFIEYGGAAKAVADTKRTMSINYALAAFTVIALLSIAFDGRTGALILASCLFSFVGAVAAALLFGGVLSLGALVGFIALFGISMRSAILLFDQLEDLVVVHHAHWSTETVILASRRRLAPLLITALLAALALLPLAVDAGQIGREILGPMAVVILGGLFTGTLGNLIVLPVMILTFWRPAYARRARHIVDHKHA
jgi:CzcA family heavy metal efflux pump